MTAKPFGVMFGRLVRQKRAKLGLSQEALAERALGSPLRKAEISRLETGKIENPHAQTLEAIRTVLGISDDEISRMRAEAGAVEDTVQAILGRLAREGQDAFITGERLSPILTKFGIEQPDALTAEEQVALLRSKAADYARLRAEIESIDERSTAVGSLKNGARDAIARLDLPEVERLLARVCEIETEIVAESKFLRGQNTLLMGDARKAYDCFTAAAAAVKQS